MNTITRRHVCVKFYFDIFLFLFFLSKFQFLLKWLCGFVLRIYHENPMNNMKRQNDMTPENDTLFPGQKVSNTLLGNSRGQLLIAPERMKQLNQSRNDAQLWMCLVVKVKSDAIKNNIAWEAGILGKSR